MRSAPILFAAACTALLAAVYLVAFGTARGLRFDLSTFAHQGTSSLPRVQLATAGMVGVVDVASLVLVGGGLVLGAWYRGRRDIAVAGFVLLAGATVTSQVLKPVLRAADPFRHDALRLYHGSFPSGHATIAMAVSLALVLAAPTAWKTPAALVGAGYSAAIGASLLIQRWHYASDVAAGFLIAGAWAGLALAWRPVEPPKTWPESTRAGAAVAAALVAAFALAVVLVLRTHPGARDHVEDYTLFTLAVGGFAALAAAVCGGFALLQRR